MSICVKSDIEICVKSDIEICVKSDIETLGASVKDNGLANCGRGWSLIYKARALPLGPPKMQLLELSVDLFKEHVQLHPNDWVANYDAGNVCVCVYVCVYVCV